MTSTFHSARRAAGDQDRQVRVVQRSLDLTCQLLEKGTRHFCSQRLRTQRAINAYMQVRCFPQRNGTEMDGMNVIQSKHLRHMIIVGLIAVAARCGVARAAVVYDNLGPAPYWTSGYATFGLYSDGVRYERGMQFIPSQTVTLSTLELALGEAFFTSGNPAQSGTAKVRLLTDSGNAPGAELEMWTSATISGSPTTGGVLSFTSLLTPTLTAGVKYWIVLGEGAGSNLGGAWYFADDNHTGNTLTMWRNSNTGVASYATLTRGYRTRVSGDLPSVAPNLAIARSGDNVEISWNTNATGGTLQGTATLNPAITWTNLSVGIIVSNRYVVTEPIGNGAKFYRWAR
jgi:hypothetical protein